MEFPKLKHVNKIEPPFKLGNFPAGFVQSIGRDIVYLLATKGQAEFTGDEWERTFAKAIGAEWKPSNIGLDDVILGNCAWSAKTVKASSKNVLSQSRVRLISGRCSPTYSFGATTINPADADPNIIGSEVLAIWNARVDEVRARFPHLRTVVLIKGEGLLINRVFEVETCRYDYEEYSWAWNKNGNLEGTKNGAKHFVWQPHGSQFTIIENVPSNCIGFTVRQPGTLNEDDVLKSLSFDSSWIEVIE